MSKTKFMLCRYPVNGFGRRNGMYYLLDVFGNTYDIFNAYDFDFHELNVCVTINGIDYCDTCLDWLIKKIENDTDSTIKRWL